MTIDTARGTYAVDVWKADNPQQDAVTLHGPGSGRVEMPAAVFALLATSALASLRRGES